MAPGSFPPYPPRLDESQRLYILSNLKDWSIAHGLAVRPSYVSPEQDPSGSLAATAPVTLFPSLFPRACFDQARQVARTYNELYSAIACDQSWLKGIVEELIGIDDYISELWKVHLAVQAEGQVQPISLGLFRSDYMVHVDSLNPRSDATLKQVEFNTIASSFGGLSRQVSALHRHLWSIDAYPEDGSTLIHESSLPPNASVPGMTLGIAKAHEAYGESATGLPKCVLFVVQDPERNVFDQRHLEYALKESHGVKTFRLPFGRVLADTRLDASRNLMYSPPNHPERAYEVSVVYFRAAYAPSEYTGPADWDARLHIERSAAIKCPNILTHLAGSKKVQQVLATPHSPHLDRFLPDEADASEVRKTFAPIYPLDQSDAGLEARKLATHPATAKRYVVKPQREGGGNNIYREDIPEFLRTLPEPQWPAHILMEMIEPPAQENIIFRNGEVQRGSVICELGIYGVCLWQSGDKEGGRTLLENFEAGFLLRTKGAGSSEGGVAAGFGCVDSPCLV